MTLMCLYNHGEILGSGCYHKGFLLHGLHVSHESRVVIDISNTDKHCELSIVS